MTNPKDDVRLFYESRFLGAWDLLGRDVTVTIEKIVAGVVEGEKGRKDKAPIVHFVGAKKPMVLNKTNAKTIAELYGTFNASELAGKRVTLYATTTRSVTGGTVDCIRVRNVRPTQKRDSAIVDVPVDVEMRKNQMQQAGEAGAPSEGSGDAS